MDPISFVLGGASVILVLTGMKVASSWGPVNRVDGIDLPLPTDDSWKLRRGRHGRYFFHPNSVKVYLWEGSGPFISVKDMVLGANFDAFRYRRAIKKFYMSKVAQLGPEFELPELDDSFEERLRLAEERKAQGQEGSAT